MCWSGDIRISHFQSKEMQVVGDAFKTNKAHLYCAEAVLLTSDAMFPKAAWTLFNGVSGSVSDWGVWSLEGRGRTFVVKVG